MSFEPQLHRPQPASVILIEEHQKVRNALAQSFLHQPNIQLLDALAYLPSRPEKLLAFDPNVVLIGFPQNAVSQMSTLFDHVSTWADEGIATVVLAPYLDSEVSERLFESGVYAHVHKTIDMQKLGNVISMAHHFSRDFLKQP